VSVSRQTESICHVSYVMWHLELSAVELPKDCAKFQLLLKSNWSLQGVRTFYVCV
jgi:hypothetical protein